MAELAKILPEFSEVGHMQCFIHIVNLVVKSIIKQFDVPKKREDEHLDEAEHELHNLASYIKLEEQEAVEEMVQHQMSGNTDSETEEDKEDDDVDGWVDEMMLVSPAEYKKIFGLSSWVS